MPGPRCRRYRLAFGQRQLVGGVIEDELPLGEGIDAVPEFGAFTVANQLWVHHPNIAL